MAGQTRRACEAGARAWVVGVEKGRGEGGDGTGTGTGAGLENNEGRDAIKHGIGGAGATFEPSPERRKASPGATRCARTQRCPQAAAARCQWLECGGHGAAPGRRAGSNDGDKQRRSEG